MKIKYLKGILLSSFFICIIFMVGCGETELDPISTEKNEVSAQSLDQKLIQSKEANMVSLSDCAKIKRAVINENGMLVFKDMKHFWQCSQCLATEHENYNDAYEAQYPNATAEELDKIDEKNKFYSEKPYLDFENSKKFKSLRAKIESQTNRWLKGTHADLINWDDIPEISTPVIDDAIRALYNTNGFVKVGKNILDEKYFGEQNRGKNEIDEKFIWDECAFSRTSYGIDFFGDHAIVVSVGVTSGLVTSTAIGKTLHFKRIDNTWRQKRGRITAAVGGPSFNGECVIMPASQNWQAFKSQKKRRSRTARSRIWFLWREALVEDKTDPLTGQAAGVWPAQGLVARGSFENNPNVDVILTR